MPAYEQRRDLAPISAFPDIPDPTKAPDGSLMGAAFRQENLVGAFFNDDRFISGARLNDELYYKRFNSTPDDEFNAWDQIEGTQYEDHWEDFAGVRSAAEFESLRGAIDSEERDRTIIADAGLGGFLASMVAGTVDVPSLIPGVQVIRGVPLGRSVTRNGARVASASLSEATATEAALHSIQQTRTAGESQFAIGGSVVLGFILGGAAGAAVRNTPNGPRVLQEAANGLDGKPAQSGIGLDQGLREAEGVGADVVSVRPDNEDFVNPSRVAQGVIDYTPSGVTFGFSFIKAKSPIAQKLGLDLVDTPFAIKGTDRLDLEPAVEIAQSVDLDRYRISIGRAFKSGYADVRKREGTSRVAGYTGYTGGRMSEKQFAEEVAKALRRNDQHSNPAVRATAKRMRDDVIEPLKKMAIKNDLLPKDVGVSTADSYFTRVWDAREIVRRSDEFKARIAKHFDGEFRTLKAKGVEGYDLSDVELSGYASEAAESVFQTLTNPGRIPDNLNLTAKTRGPMKERTLNVRDLDFEDFLENDSEFVLNRYVRVMTADNHLKERFGSTDLEGQIRDVVEDYTKLIDAEKDPKVREGLRAEQERIVDRIEAVRDLMRGTYQLGTKNGMPYRVIQSAMSYNFIRILGGLVTSALPDAYRMAMVHGVSNVWEGALRPMMANIKGSSMARKQALDLAGIAEVELNNRMMSIADITDPTGNRTPVENTINSMAGWASKFSGGNLWNDFMKGIATQVTTNRLRKLSGSKADLAFKNRLKLNSRDADAIKSALNEYGIEANGVFDPRIDKWPERTRDLYARVLRADADTTIVTPGIGDKIPGAEHHYWLKPALQFKSFAIASHGRSMIAGLQEDQVRFLTSAAAMSAMGMFVYWLKAQSSGLDTSDDPGTWIAEGIDRSGLFPLIMEANNWQESITGFGVYDILSQGEAEASRYAVRSTSGKVLGPTAGLINDMATVLSRVAAQVVPYSSEEAQKVTKGDISAMRRLIPFGRHPGVKEYLDLWMIPRLKEDL